MRLDKYLSHTTGYSRSRIKQYIKAGAVQADNATISDPAFQVTAGNRIVFEGEAVAQPEPRYFMLHKPVGYVSATRDRNHLTVLDLLDERRLEKLQIVGRLDIDASGLMLLTDDGQWNHHLTSPQRHISKTYWVKLAEPIPPNAIARCSQGVWLKHEHRRTLPAQLEHLSEYEARLTLAEGRYHQVKRMFAALGNRVIALHRERIGHIVLDPKLAPGEYRRLSQAEIACSLRLQAKIT